MAALLCSAPAAASFYGCSTPATYQRPMVFKRLRACSCSSEKTQNNPFDLGYGHTDLYGLLGVEKSASFQEIRRSYRWMQKKCHPDIAGPPGHNMSILLNHAYTTLSDPNQRAAYDQTLADSMEFKGYTGFPLYSRWFGPAEENRAVFVDESRCVGCLKCALIAPRTFAIETRFGRARAVGQWADPESFIEAAIDACPVDCIMWVNKSQLPAIEFVMSKMPRFPVGIEVHSNGGVNTKDVFKEVEVFLEKLQRKEQRNSSDHIETAAQRKERLAAMEEIQARTGRWWSYFIGKSAAEDQTNSRIHSKAQRAVVPLIFYQTGRDKTNADGRFENKHINFPSEEEHPFEASRFDWFSNASLDRDHDEYWTPVIGTSLPNIQTPIAEDGRIGHKGSFRTQPISKPLTGWARDFVSGMPVWSSGLAAWYVGVTCRSGTVALSDTEIGLGPVPVDWMKSLELQTILTALVWYLIGACFSNALVLVVSTIQARDKDTLQK